MAGPTRQQGYFLVAQRHVESVTSATARTRETYGALCHKFPVLLHVNGLAKTVAFVESKAAGKGDVAVAYRKLDEHVRECIAIEAGRPAGEVRQILSSAPTTEYMRYTRSLRERWVYYKRFAVSILEVADASQAEDRP